jgi:ribosomal protein S27AE
VTYRTAPRACLACKTPLEPMGKRLRCGNCRSSLVPRAEVDDAIRQMARQDEHHAMSAITPLTGGFASTRRACPRCGDAMTPCLFATIPIDECRAHGIWFDHDEFERVLHASAPKTTSDDEDGPVETAGGILEGVGHVLQILNIFF